MTQTTLTPATHSLPHRDALDVHLIVTFTPSDPVGLTVVEVAGGDVPTARYLALIETAAARLAVYAEDFRHAAEHDAE